ncbi:CGNR zinc finger domain-containing protein [Bailinhaonella thermotolerans]|uniref:Zinc finger CGNR domain-containing protein n=1 Tax=Bailinhaonella thermotolerans TaxID=1070861 RepID=A0A3A4AS65_9ACTN|nr:ABATE domain-containing protein [Bailinhaonella thermotolerans]RJL24158.1 hypothetical protein D5H75_30390 [Bailinhaonella thermotolerans]
MTAQTPLTGEPLALDLVNTRHATGDHLSSPAALRAWLDLQAVRHGEAREFAALPLTERDLAAARQVRDRAAHALDRVRHGAAPEPADLDALNLAQRAAPSVGELGWDGEAVTLTFRRAGPRDVRLAAWLAEAVAGLLADPAVARVRQCEADDCVMLFLPAHPRRRWCSAARCGNRTRVARHYQRRRPA